MTLLLTAGPAAGAEPAAAEQGGSLELFFDPSRPALRQLFLPGTTVLEHLDVAGFHERILAAQEASGGILYDASGLASPGEAALDAGLREAVAAGRYAAAAQAGYNERIALVKSFYPELTPASGQWARAAMQAAADFIAGRDAHALLRASYALSLNPVAPGLAGFMRALESATGMAGMRIPGGTGLSLLEVKLNATKELYGAKRYEDMLAVCRDILILKPGDPTALARLGSGYYMMGDFKRASAIWNLALVGENRAGERRSLEAMIARAANALRPAPRPAVDGAALETLYREGVAAHARGDAAAARAAFEKMNALLPGEPRARKALRRLSAEAR